MEEENKYENSDFVFIPELIYLNQIPLKFQGLGLLIPWNIAAIKFFSPSA